MVLKYYKRYIDIIYVEYLSYKLSMNKKSMEGGVGAKSPLLRIM